STFVGSSALPSTGPRLDSAPGWVKPAMRRTVIILLAMVLPAGALSTIAWDEAEDHVGEEVVVRGRVVDIHCSPLSCLLAFEPSFNRFTAVVQAKRFDTFPPDRIEQQFGGKRVQVHGTVVLNDKKPEIVVDSADDLKLTLAERRQENDPTRAQTEVLDRLAAVLEQVTALTERMAATQERMETLLASME